MRKHGIALIEKIASYPQEYWSVLKRGYYPRLSVCDCLQTEKHRNIWQVWLEHGDFILGTASHCFISFITSVKDCEADSGCCDCAFRCSSGAGGVYELQEVARGADNVGSGGRSGSALPGETGKRPHLPSVRLVLNTCEAPERDSGNCCWSCLTSLCCIWGKYLLKGEQEGHNTEANYWWESYYS